MPEPSLGVGGGSPMRPSPLQWGRVLTYELHPSGTEGCSRSTQPPLGAEVCSGMGTTPLVEGGRLPMCPTSLGAGGCSRRRAIPPPRGRWFMHVPRPRPPPRYQRGSPVHSTTPQRGSSDATVKPNISWMTVFTFTAEAAMS